MRYFLFLVLLLVGCNGAPTEMSERDYQMACIRGCKDAKRACQHIRPAMHTRAGAHDERCHREYLICYVDHCHMNQMLQYSQPL